MKYWIIVASKDHVEKGIDKGFVQASHDMMLLPIFPLFP